MNPSLYFEWLLTDVRNESVCVFGCITKDKNTQRHVIRQFIFYKRGYIEEIINTGNIGQLEKYISKDYLEVS